MSLMDRSTSVWREPTRLGRLRLNVSPRRPRFLDVGMKLMDVAIQALRRVDELQTHRDERRPRGDALRPDALMATWPRALPSSVDP
jgi:hypothetical protein